MMSVRPSHLATSVEAAAHAGANPQEALLVCLARQPVFDAAYVVRAWELLFRSAPASGLAAVHDPSVATSQVITTAAIEIGLDRLVGTLPAHINFPRPFLTGELPIPLPPQRTVIEVLEDVRGDADVIAGLRRLRAAGYGVALDDYTSRDGDARLLEVADIVKVDLSLEPAEGLARLASELRRRPLRLLAEKVESREQFELCRAAGFDLFQGYFLQRPETFSASRPPASRLASLQLLAELQNPDCTSAQLERLVATDVATSYRVLRCINSSFFGLSREVTSVGQAIALLGLERLRQLCAIVVLSGFNDRPQLLSGTALVRARMCESLATALGAGDGGAYFLTGLMSVLDAMLALPMPEALRQLPLGQDIAAALQQRSGRLGAVLACVIAWERGEWDAAAIDGLAPERLQVAYLEALEWAEHTRAMLAD